MEEIYLLLEERLLNNEDLNNRVNKLEEIRGRLVINQNSRPPEFQELSQYIQQLKRAEKLRSMKENDLLETVFGLRNFETTQRQRFQEKSYELMKKIKQDFTYEKYRKTGETKDIAKLYLNFFLALKLQSRIEDLKRAYANNKFIGYPIVSVLLKWLVEISRKAYQDSIKEKSDLLGSWMSNKVVRSPVVTPKEPQRRANKLTKMGSDSTPDSANSTITHEGKHLADTVRKTIDLIRLEKANALSKDRESASADNTTRPRTIEARISTENVRKNFKSYLDQQLRSDKISEDPQNNSLMLTKSIRINNPKPGPKEKVPNLVQIYVQNNNQIQNYLDPLEDLDVSHISTVYQVIHLYRQVKKVSTGNLIVIDLDKKKEMLQSLYKNLYQRNWEVERTVTAYQAKLKEKDKIDYQPNFTPKKGENFCENYSINFVQRFPHVLPQNLNISIQDLIKSSRDSQTINPPALKPSSSQKKLMTQSTTITNTATTAATIENNSTITVPDKNTSTINDQDRIETIDQSVLHQKTEEPEMHKNTRNRLNKTENHFRIIRKRFNSYKEPESVDKNQTKQAGSLRQSVDEKCEDSTLAQSTILKPKETEEIPPNIPKLKPKVKYPFSERYRSASLQKFRSTTNSNIQWEQVNQLKPGGVIPTDSDIKITNPPQSATSSIANGLGNKAADFILRVSMNEMKNLIPDSSYKPNENNGNKCATFYGGGEGPFYRKNSISGRRPVTGAGRKKEVDESRDQTIISDSNYNRNFVNLSQSGKFNEPSYSVSTLQN